MAMVKLREPFVMAKLGKALMSLLLDKKAREALETKAALKAVTPERPARTLPAPASLAPEPALTPAPITQPSREEINARLDHAADVASGRVKSPDRKQLIQNALNVRADKAKMLDDLPEEQRRRLQALAMMSFMKPPQGS